MSEKQGGQTLLLTVLVIAGVILMVSTLAGLIMSYSLRQVTNAQASAQAIFAADAGIECILYYHFCNTLGTGGSCASVDCSSQPMTNVWNLSCGGSNPPTYFSPSDNKLYSDKMQCIASDPAAGSQTWVSIGQDAASTTARSLRITLSQIQ
ncbi:MAG: hypothetical protein KGL39_18260 [Patescibacteria group bacterium]|nr:hypothetical protein [Patescibacteria group bacterium]